MTLLDTLFGVRCRLCGKRGAALLGAVPPTHPGEFHTKNFTLRHCINCDVVYLDPLPTQADLRLLYEESVQFSADHYTDAVQVGKIMDYYTNSVRDRALLAGSRSRVLEIGAGLAWVSRACKAADAAVVTVAQDVSGECAQTCPWVDHYFVGALDTMPDMGPYQLISLTHVIEHLADPAAMLRTVATLLAPAGKVFITAPFRPTGWHPSQGIAAWRDYSYLHVPAHITYFSRRWFAQHARVCGLEIVHWDESHESGQAFELVLRKK